VAELKSYEGSIFHLPPTWLPQSRHFPGLRRKCGRSPPPLRFDTRTGRCRGKITTKLTNSRAIARSDQAASRREGLHCQIRAASGSSCDRSDLSSSRTGAFQGEIQGRYRSSTSSRASGEGGGGRRMTTSLSETYAADACLPALAPGGRRDNGGMKKSPILWSQCRRLDKIASSDESLQPEEARLSTGCSGKMIKRTRGRKFNYSSRMKVSAIGRRRSRLIGCTVALM